MRDQEKERERERGWSSTDQEFDLNENADIGNVLRERRERQRKQGRKSEK